MPRGQPFTALCASLARPPMLDRADLHLHTIHSDGKYTPTEVVQLARRCGLAAVAVTDHDTLDGVEPTRRAALGTGIEIVSGVEITTEHRGRERHLLAYFVSLDPGPLTRALERLRVLRRERFLKMIDRLREQGVKLGAVVLPEGDESLGRRRLAEILVSEGHASDLRDAFRRWLRDGGRADVPKTRLPIAEAIECVRAAGGTASLAHPPENCTLADLAELKSFGMSAIEVEHPGFRTGRTRALRDAAAALGLAVTGGSDCHGDDAPGRAIGSRTVTRQELDRLRGLASSLHRRDGVLDGGVDVQNALNPQLLEQGAHRRADAADPHHAVHLADSAVQGEQCGAGGAVEERHG